MIIGPVAPAAAGGSQWGVSVGIPLLGVLVLFAAAPLGVWAAALSGLVAGAAAVAMHRQHRVEKTLDELAEHLATVGDAATGDSPSRHRRIAAIADLIAVRLGADAVSRREMAIAVVLRALDRSSEMSVRVSADGRTPPGAMVAGCVSAWASPGAIASGNPQDARGRQALLIIDFADRYDTLRSQGLRPVAALNLLAAGSTPEERVVLEALNDAVVLSVSF